jgi:hypothetical protein
MVIGMLRALADSGKTVLVTIHQPEMELYGLFDHLLMLWKDLNTAQPGRLAYFGPTVSDSLDFFCPGIRNPRPSTIFEELKKQKTDLWVEKYQRSPQKAEFIDKRLQQPVAAAKGPVARVRSKTGMRQLWTLVARKMTILRADRMQMALLLGQAPIFALLVVAAVGHLSDAAKYTDAAAWANLCSNVGAAEFLMVVAAIWFGCNNSAREIVGEWAIYERERMVNLKIASYTGSKLIVNFLLCVVQCVSMLTIVYFGVGLAGSYPKTLLVLLMTSMVGVALGLCVSALVRTTEAAIGFLPLVLLPMIVFGGGMKPIHEMKSVEFLTSLTPSRWAYEANVVEEGTHRKGRYEYQPDKLVVQLDHANKDLAAKLKQAQEQMEKARRAQAQTSAAVAGAAGTIQGSLDRVSPLAGARTRPYAKKIALPGPKVPAVPAAAGSVPQMPADLDKPKVIDDDPAERSFPRRDRTPFGAAVRNLACFFLVFASMVMVILRRKDIV